MLRKRLKSKIKRKCYRSVKSDFLPPHGLSMEFSRQKYWSGLPFPSPGNLPDPGVKGGYPALQANFLPSDLPGVPKRTKYWGENHNKNLKDFPDGPVQGHGFHPGPGRFPIPRVRRATLPDHSCGACTPWSRCSATREATAMRSPRTPRTQCSQK